MSSHAYFGASPLLASSSFTIFLASRMARSCRMGKHYTCLPFCCLQVPGRSLSPTLFLLNQIALLAPAAPARPERNCTLRDRCESFGTPHKRLHSAHPKPVRSHK